MAKGTIGSIKGFVIIQDDSKFGDDLVTYSYRAKEEYYKQYRLSRLKCHCGVDAVNGPIHSDWCPKKELEGENDES